MRPPSQPLPRSVVNGRARYRALATLNLLKTIASLSDRELGETTEYVEANLDTRVDMAVFYARSVSSIERAWLEWESSCRGERRRECEDQLPREARDYGVSSYYSTSIKEVIVMAAEDLSVDWMLPPWLIWFSHRVKRPLLRSLRELDPKEQLLRTIVYPVFAHTLLGIAARLLEEYQRRSEYAGAAASFVYWDVCAPLVIAVKEALHPIPRLRPILEAAARDARERGSQAIQLSTRRVAETLLAVVSGSRLAAYKEKDSRTPH